MSKYGDDERNMQKENLYYEMEDFLETHDIHELLEVVTDVVEAYEDEMNNKDY